jgi:hypothetical protein
MRSLVVAACLSLMVGGTALAQTSISDDTPQHLRSRLEACVDARMADHPTMSPAEARAALARTVRECLEMIRSARPPVVPTGRH